MASSANKDKDIPSLRRVVRCSPDEHQGSDSSDDEGSDSSDSEFYEYDAGDDDASKLGSYDCLKAFQEVVTLAMDFSNTWCTELRSTGMFSLDPAEMIFRAPVPPAKRLEVSVASAVIHISASDLANTMMSANEWCKLLFPLVNNALQLSREVILLEDLKKIDPSIEGVVRMHAEFVLPTVPLRSFEFLRFKKKIMEDTFMIVDISAKYVSDEILPTNSLRRPSGVLIRERGPKSCEIVVVENVVVNKPENSTYSSLLNMPNLPFSASHWITVVLWNRGRDRSRFIHSEPILRNPRDADVLLAVTQAMKCCFMDFVCRKQEIIIPLVDKTLQQIKTSVKSLKVKASPRAVFEFLVKHDIKMKLPGDPNMMLKLVSKDRSNVISLYGSEVSGSKLFCLQEASRCEYCSFVLSITVSDEKKFFSLEILDGEEMLPTGFAILPDGQGGLSCPASIVTILHPFPEGVHTALEDSLNQIQELDDMFGAMYLDQRT